MYSLIKQYKHSCVLVKDRIKFLKEWRNQLIKSNNQSMIEENDIDRRIRLLNTENAQMQEIISHLSNYVKEVEKRVKT